MSTSDLGIEVERLTVMPPENRASFILQKRVEMLRKVAGAGSEKDWGMSRPS
jgi:hypothetical protein